MSGLTQVPVRALGRMHDRIAQMTAALERIAGFTLSQFMGPHDMALECVEVANKALGTQPASQPCSMGVGCDEAGVCYAEAHDSPEQCPHAEPFASGSLPPLPAPTEMWTTHDSTGRAMPTYGYTRHQMYEYARQSVHLADESLLGFARWLLDAYHSDEGMPEAKEIAKEARAALSKATASAA